jgi:hypothetical protein
MNFGAQARIVAALALLAGLAGCMDVTANVDLESATTARATMTETVDARFYPMLTAAKGQGARDEDDRGFCHRGKLTENRDGSATCVESREGAFSTLSFGAKSDGNDIRFAAAGPGRVRVSLATGAIGASLTHSAAADHKIGEAPSSGDAEAQTRQMMAGYFEGHYLTFRISGGNVVDTNMTRAPDGRSAQARIAFSDIINGAAQVPPELYAVLQVQ